MGFLEGLFVLLAMAAAGVGALFLTQATMGVGIIGLALVAAVFARIAQAGKHQEENQRATKVLSQPPH